MQFNLRFLFAAMAAVAIGAYALIYANGQPRFFWLGFAVFGGWGYLILLHVPISTRQPANKKAGWCFTKGRRFRAEPLRGGCTAKAYRISTSFRIGIKISSE